MKDWKKHWLYIEPVPPPKGPNFFDGFWGGVILTLLVIAVAVLLYFR